MQHLTVHVSLFCVSINMQNARPGSILMDLTMVFSYIQYVTGTIAKLVYDVSSPMHSEYLKVMLMTSQK